MTGQHRTFCFHFDSDAQYFGSYYRKDVDIISLKKIGIEFFDNVILQKEWPIRVECDCNLFFVAALFTYRSVHVESIIEHLWKEFQLNSFVTEKGRDVNFM